MEAQQQCSGVKTELGNEAGWLDDISGNFDAYSCKQSCIFMHRKIDKRHDKNNEQKEFFCLWEGKPRQKSIDRDERK